ncbi:MAG: flagellar protein FlgN [Herminiimonas sp.]|nr:flagellar protein FlgN [Herminiimonas sp.]
MSPADSLPQEQQAARVLIDLLQQEQAALISADIDSLTMITERKTPVVAQMSELATKRHRALATLGHAASEIGMQAWVESPQPGQAEHTQAAAAWTALLAMARQAKEINRVNGLLISSHIARNQSALNVLRVQTGGGNFYGPDGQATARGVGRGLVVG